MKIAILSGLFPPRAAAEADYCLQLCERLAALGHDVDLITTHQEELAPAVGYRVHAIMKSWSWREAPTLVKTLRAIRPHTVLLLYLGWIYNHQSMVTFLPSIVRHYLAGTKMITLFYNRYGANRARARRHQLIAYWLAKKITGEPNLIFEFGSLLTRSDRVISLCENHAITYRTLYPPCAPYLDIIPPSVLIPLAPGGKKANRDDARRELGLTAQDEAIVFFGYLYGPKRLPNLIEALALLKRPRAKLVLVGGMIDPRADGGENPHQALLDLARKSGVEKQILFTGGFAHDSLNPSRFLYAADVFCLPFDRGVQMNNSSFAAVAWHEAPIVTTRGSWTEPVFRDGENSLLCEPDDPAALTAALRKVLEDPLLAERLAKGAGTLARAQFAWDPLLRTVSS